MTSVFDRRRNETVADHVERLFQDPMFDGATASELAAFAGCSREDAARARRRFFKVQGARLVLEHAALVAERVQWPFDAAALIHLALERYVERFQKNVGLSAAPQVSRGTSRLRDLGAGYSQDSREVNATG